MVRATQWAVTCKHGRQRAPANSHAAVLLYAGARPERLESTPRTYCVGDTSSLLTSERRVFLIRSSRLYELDLASGETVPVEVQGVAAGWRYSQLLALARRSSVLTLLVSMVRGQGQESETRLWRLVFEHGAFAATPLEEHELPADVHAFRAQYITPRCASGLDDCLVIAEDALVVGSRGRPGVASADAPEGWLLLDAVWLPAERGGREVLLLAAGTCPESPGTR